MLENFALLRNIEYSFLRTEFMSSATFILVLFPTMNNILGSAPDKKW